MPPRLTRVLAELPAVTPFVGPETIERRRGRQFALRLGANESAFGISPKARAALAGALDRIAWYCDPEHFDLRERLAERLDVTRGNVVIGEGIDGLLGLIVRACTEPGDAIVTSAGAYPTFNYHATGYGARLVFVPYDANCRNDAAALVEVARRNDAKLLYLSNPDNPTGSFLPRAEIEALLDALPGGCLLVLDEAYAEFAPPEELLLVSGDDPRLIRLRTFSKAHGMAGLRIGYGVGATELTGAFEKIRLHFGVGRLSQIAAAASLEDADFAAGVVAEVARGRTDYEALARSLQIPTLPSLTNFVAFDFGSGPESLRALQLLEERDVFVRRPGVAPLDRFVRVTVGTPEERKAFAKILPEVVAEMRG